MTESANRLHLYTGDGKGKTSIAVGMVVRALGAGLKVAFIQFDKGYDGGEDFYSERKVLRTFEDLYLFSSGKNRMNDDGTFRFGVTDDDSIEAKIALEKSMQVAAASKYDLVILDEAITSVGYGLISKDDLMNILGAWVDADKPCELVLTGRGAWDELIESADLVSEVTKVKHYFDEGGEAKRGIEY